MSRKRDAEALVRRVFGSDDESSEGEEGGLGEASYPSRTFPGGTPWTAETPETLQTSPPPPVRFLAPDRERHVGPLADSIPGLHLVRGAFTREAQAWLLDAIRKEGLVEFPEHTSPEVCVAGNVAREAPSREYEEPYETTRHTSPHENTSRKNVHAKSFRKNQAMRFGNFPPWAAVLAERVARVAAEDGAWPARSSAEAAKGNANSGEDERGDKKKPGALPFDQFIVNAYEPGEGLKPHVDLAAFDDGVCVVSLLSSTVMDLSPAEKDAETAKVIDDDGRKKKTKNASERGGIGIRLDPGDVLFLSGEARWLWRHGIAARAADKQSVGGFKERGFRVSVTLRSLREEGRELRVAANASEG
jgi:alkylated DNA repair dioxygenase AlkB